MTGTTFGLKGWAKHEPHHTGRFHYYDYELKAVCGYQKTVIENTKNMRILDNPRPSKLCKQCLRILRLPIPELKRIV